MASITRDNYQYMTKFYLRPGPCFRGGGVALVAMSFCSATLAVSTALSKRGYQDPTNNLSGITENALALGLPATNSPGVIYWYSTNTPAFVNGATAFVIGSGVYIFSRSDL